MSSIGSKVKIGRKEKGLSQDELADGICSRQTISLLENEQHIPSAWILQKIAEKLGIPLPEILSSQEKFLEIKLQVDILKAYVASANYEPALELIQSIEENEQLLEHLEREVVLNKAECLIRTGKSQEALDVLFALQQSLEKARDHDEHSLVHTYQKIGTAFYYLSDMYNAYSNYMRAFQLTNRFPDDDALTATIHYNLGNVCRQINLDEQAIMHLSRASDLFEKFSNPVHLAHSMFALGIAYKNLKKFDQAETYLLQARSLYEAQKVHSLAQVARQGYVFGVLAKKDPQLALQELINTLDEVNQNSDEYHVAYTYARIASLSLDVDQVADAFNYLNESRKRIQHENKSPSSEYPFVSDPRIAFVFQVDAKYHLSIGDYQKCLVNSYKSAEMFDKMGLKHDSADSLKLSVQAYEQLGQLNDALQIAKQIVELLQPMRDVSFTT